jgi:hypothetical protein
LFLQSFWSPCTCRLKLRRDHANVIFQTIIDIQRKESSAGRMIRKYIVFQKTLEMIFNGPEYFNLENVRTKVKTIGQTSLDICCKQEIERMQAVFTTLLRHWLILN